MMGHRHALTGVLAAAGISLATGADVPSGLVLFTLLPGFCLLPDLDHKDASASGVLGQFTKIPSMLLGHRRETHSIPGIGVIGLITQFAVWNVGNVVANLYLMLVLVIGWLAVLKAFRVNGNFRLIAFVVAGVIVWFPEQLQNAGLGFPLDVLPWAVAVGMFVHVLGDLVTKQPIPLMWPLSQKKTCFNWFKTNGVGEALAAGVIVFSITTTTGQWLFVLATQRT